MTGRGELGLWPLLKGMTLVCTTRTDVYPNTERIPLMWSQICGPKVITLSDIFKNIINNYHETTQQRSNNKTTAKYLLVCTSTVYSYRLCVYSLCTSTNNSRHKRLIDQFWKEKKKEHKLKKTEPKTGDGDEVEYEIQAMKSLRRLKRFRPKCL